jgi:hypothetical protein
MTPRSTNKPARPASPNVRTVDEMLADARTSLDRVRPDLLQAE